MNWFHHDVTLVLATDGDQGFHWRRGTALSHSSSVKRGTRRSQSELPHSCLETNTLNRELVQTEAAT